MLLSKCFHLLALAPIVGYSAHSTPLCSLAVSASSSRGLRDFDFSIVATPCFSAGFLVPTTSIYLSRSFLTEHEHHVWSCIAAVLDDDPAPHLAPASNQQISTTCESLARHLRPSESEPSDIQYVPCRTATGSGDIILYERAVVESDRTYLSAVETGVIYLISGLWSSTSPEIKSHKRVAIETGVKTRISAMKSHHRVAVELGAKYCLFIIILNLSLMITSNGVIFPSLKALSTCQVLVSFLHSRFLHHVYYGRVVYTVVRTSVFRIFPTELNHAGIPQLLMAVSGLHYFWLTIFSCSCSTY
ncbi:hypothetical protein R3P38DRAFT_880188 [Favolaschia claudopus]|uniref:Uncharacterized protein n=1 Tax=Favolaschia claudopus TaxID=2862362 RepID=A0AAW0BR28_9AGAR